MNTASYNQQKNRTKQPAREIEELAGQQFKDHKNAGLEQKQ